MYRYQVQILYLLYRNKRYLSVIPAEDVIAATEKMLPQNVQTDIRDVSL